MDVWIADDRTLRARGALFSAAIPRRQVDFIVELVDQPEYYFFVQVKTTTLGYTADPIRLRVHVSQTDIDRMVACPAPSYVVGIDMNSQNGFLLSVNEARDHVASLTTRFKLDCSQLGKLANEVRQYWATRNMVLSDSQFKE